MFCLKLYWLLVMRIGQNSQKLIKKNENRTFERFSFFFYQFLTVLTNFQFLCCLVVLSILSKFSMISSVLGQFGQKIAFFVKKICFAVCS